MARLHTGRDKVLSTYRSYHGNTGAADRRDRRLAADAERVRPRACALLRPLPVPQRVLGDHARAGVRARAAAPRRVIQAEGPAGDRRDPAGVDPGHRRHPDAAARLPRRRARARATKLRHHADPRRGDGRLRPHRRWFAFDALRRRARPDHLREGRQLRLRAGRRRDHLATRSRPTSTTTVFPGGLTYSGHPAGHGLDRRRPGRHGGRGHRRQRGDDRARRTSPRRSRSSPRSTTSSARCAARACSGRSSSSPTGATREPVGAAVMGRIKKELLSRGLLPFTAGQPHPRRAAVHRHRRRGRRGRRRLRRGPRPRSPELNSNPAEGTP